LKAEKLIQSFRLDYLGSARGGKLGRTMGTSWSNQSQREKLVSRLQTALASTHRHFYSSPLYPRFIPLALCGTIRVELTKAVKAEGELLRMYGRRCGHELGFAVYTVFGKNGLLCYATDSPPWFYSTLRLQGDSSAKLNHGKSLKL
jgi:hypothetical protein